jgi:hypothetical protein
MTNESQGQRQKNSLGLLHLNFVAPILDVWLQLNCSRYTGQGWRSERSLRLALPLKLSLEALQYGYAMAVNQ